MIFIPMTIPLHYLNTATIPTKEKTLIKTALRIILFLHILLTPAPYSLLSRKLNESYTVRAQVKRKHILFLLKPGM